MGYKTTEFEKGRLEKGTIEQLMTMAKLSSEDMAEIRATFILNFVKKFGEDAFDVARKASYEHGLRVAQKIKKLAEENREDTRDPRVVRKYLRMIGGFLGVVKHCDEVMEGDPLAGKYKFTYQITSCSLADTWRKMGLPLDLQFKLCSATGNASDIAVLSYFGHRIYEDQGMPKGQPACGFVMEGPMTKKERQAWLKQMNNDNDFRKYVEDIKE